MSHHTAKESYRRMSERLNRFPQGAPPTKLLFQILEVLFSPKEAELVSLLPIKPFNVKAAAHAWKQTEAEARFVLDELASRGMMLDTEIDGEQAYVMPPPMAGFFEFSMMRVGNKYDQKLLAKLFYQYLNVEEDFIRALFAGGETQLGRVFVNEPALATDNTIHVLEYERATEVVQTASHLGLGTCYCRHKMLHVGRACAAPMNICMTFNSIARSLIKHGIARQVDASEGQELLLQAIENNLVQFGENVREQVSFICNCCGCCCEAMLAAKRFAFLNPVATTNFLPVVKAENCNGCGKCTEVCPVEAMGQVAAGDPHNAKRRKARVDERLCLGCGVCVTKCPHGAIALHRDPAHGTLPAHRYPHEASQRDTGTRPSPRRVHHMEHVHHLPRLISGWL